jgi:glutamyl-Q tRNA(Asp) synthetase
MSSIYKGRFAPTPSGPAHLGTMLAAVGSYLQARAKHGEWHVRIDDIDPPREVPGAADSILHTLEQYGLHWDGEVVYQSRRLDAYHDALQQLVAQGVAYECSCSRKQINQAARRGMNGMIYPGTCRSGCDVNSPHKYYSYCE